jgi:hypothetical protein
MTLIKNKMRSISAFILTLYWITAIELIAENQKIALYYPELSISVESENANWLIENFYRWELFLVQNKFKYDVIDDSDLETISSSEFTMLILPAARCLSEDQIVSIRDFLTEGNSVLATWGLGVYNEKGEWKGWGNLEELFGAKFIAEIPQSDISKIHSIFGSTPLSSEIPAGFRLQFTTYDKPLEIKIQSGNTYPIGYLLNSNIPFEGKKETEYTTSAVYGGRGKGKFVWFGFEFSAIVGHKEHQKAANTMLINAVQWLSNGFIVQPETWPNGYQSAAVLACDVEFKFDYINNALDLIDLEPIPLQFYILTESIDLSSFDRLRNYGEIGLHGNDHLSFKFQDLELQKERLSSGINELVKLGSKKPIALRPPETYYDETTLKAMTILNMKILASDFVEDRAVPQFFENYPEIMIIPKNGFDDYDIFQRLKLESVRAQAEKYVLDFRRTHAEGGLYTLNFHTQMQCRKEYVDALLNPIEEIKARNVWTTTHDKVYDWWLSKSKIKTVTKVLDERNLQVEVENNGEKKIEGLTFNIYKKDFFDFSDIEVFLDSQKYDYTTNYDKSRISVIIPIIQPKEIIQLKINY